METQQSMRDQFLTLVKQIIEDNIGNENFTVSILAKEVGLSRSMLHRKLIRLTGKSATEFIAEIRLHRALDLLENDVATVSEIAYRLGYSSPSYFSKVFKKTYNVSPGEVRKKGSGKFSHLTVVKEPGIPGSTRSRKARSFVIAGINVLVIIIVAVGAVSLIMGPVENIFPFSRLPEWSIILIIILISGIFIVSVILSWKYRLYLDKGMVKAEQAHTIKAGEKHTLLNRWKITSYISIVVIVVLIILNIIPRANRKSTIEKSVAVLPFRNDSPDQENDHIINGTMESILNNLSRISKLKVVPRTSVERYRNTLESIPEICSELNVGYALEGSMQKYGDQLRLTIQLVDKNDYHVWSEQYDRQIKDADQYFALYSEIALLVADEIDVIFTQKEKQLIEKTQTTDLTAWDFYNRGAEELMQFRLGNKDYNAVIRAKTYFENALKYDNDFAGAYVGLGEVYWQQHYWPEFYQNNFLDSCLILANKALSIDSHIEEAYRLRGSYFEERGGKNSAIEEFEKALNLNSNSWEAHWALARLYHNYDVLLALDHSLRTIQIYKGPLLAYIFDYISDNYLMVGLIDQAKYYMNEILKLNHDSAEYFLSMAGIGTVTSNYEMALEYGLKAYQFDSTNYFVTEKIASSYFYLRRYEDAIRYYLKPYGGGASKEILLNNNDYRVSYAYWALGDQEEALFYINGYKDYCIKTIELGRSHASNYYAYYDLAAIYCFLGETENAYRNLRIFNKKERIPLWWATLIKDDPLFDNIRDEPEFQQIVHNTQAKYQAEYERVRKWLEENDLL